MSDAAPSTGQSHNNRLWGPAAFYFVGAIALQAINFLAQPLFANLMPPSELAKVAVYLFWATLLGLLISLQTGSSLNNVVSEHGAPQLKHYLNSFVNAFTMLAGLLGVLVALAPESWLAPTGLSRNYALLAVLGGWCTAVVNSAMSQAVALGRPLSFLKVTGGATVGGIGLGVLLVLALPQDPALGRILGYVIASAVLAIVFLIRLPWRPAVRIGGHLKYAVAIASPLLLHEVLSLVINQSNRVFLLNQVGGERTGVFTLAWSMGGIVALAGSALNNAWLPWYFGRLDAKQEQEILRQGRRVIWLIGLATAGLVLVSPDALLLVSASYAGGASIIPAAVAIGLLTFLFNFAANHVVYRRRTPLLLFGSVPAAVLNIALNLALIPILGLNGAVVATAAASLLLTLVAVFLNVVVLRTTHLPLGSMIAVVLLAGGALMVTDLTLSNIALRWAIAVVLGLSAAAAALYQWRSGRRNRDTSAQAPA